MRGNRRASRLVLLVQATVLTFLAGCSLLNSPGGGVNFISVGDEWKMGEEISAEIAQQGKLISTPFVDRYLDNLGRQLLAASDSDLARLPWKFHLIRDDSVNAFNIPGGHVYIHTGLVQALGDHAELSAVVGHEIGHGLARHATRHLTQQMGLSVLLSIALGNDPSAVEQIVAAYGAQGTVLKFSRDDELDADRIGIHLNYGAGIDPRGALEMFAVLASLRQSRPSSIERFMSSHPQPEDRIDEARRRIETLPDNPNLIRQTDDFVAFKKYVATL